MIWFGRYKWMTIDPKPQKKSTSVNATLKLSDELVHFLIFSVEEESMFISNQFNIELEYSILQNLHR